MLDLAVYENMTKLALLDEERGEVSWRVGELLAGFRVIDGIDTAGVAPLVTVLDVTNVLREDVPVKNVLRGTLLDNAPEQYGGYFQVPRTVE